MIGKKPTLNQTQGEIDRPAPSLNDKKEFAAEFNDETNAIKYIKKRGILAFTLSIVGAIIFAIIFMIIVASVFEGDIGTALLSTMYAFTQIAVLNYFVMFIVPILFSLLYIVPIYQCFRAISIVAKDDLILKNTKIYIALIFLSMIASQSQYITHFYITPLDNSINVLGILQTLSAASIVCMALMSLYNYKIFLTLGKLSGIWLFRFGAILQVSIFACYIFIGSKKEFSVIFYILCLLYILVMIFGFIQIKTIIKR